MASKCTCFSAFNKARKRGGQYRAVFVYSNPVRELIAAVKTQSQVGNRKQGKWTSPQPRTARVFEFVNVERDVESFKRAPNGCSRSHVQSHHVYIEPNSAFDHDVTQCELVAISHDLTSITTLICQFRRGQTPPPTPLRTSRKSSLRLLNFSRWVCVQQKIGRPPQRCITFAFICKRFSSPSVL